MSEIIKRQSTESAIFTLCDVLMAHRRLLNWNLSFSSGFLSLSRALFKKIVENIEFVTRNFSSPLRRRVTPGEMKKFLFSHHYRDLSDVFHFRVLRDSMEIDGNQRRKIEEKCCFWNDIE